MDDLASHLLDRGWIFERNPSTGDIFRRRVGDYDNREKINQVGIKLKILYINNK